MGNGFWSKFLRYSLTGFSALILLAGAQHNLFNIQKGAENILADDGTIVAEDGSDDGTIAPVGDSGDDGTIVPSGNGDDGTIAPVADRDDGTIAPVPDQPASVPAPAVAAPAAPVTAVPVSAVPAQIPALAPQVTVQPAPSLVPVAALQVPSQVIPPQQQSQTTIVRETETTQNINQPAATATAQGGNAVSDNVNTNTNNNNNSNCTGRGSCSGGGAVVSVQTAQNTAPQVALASAAAPATFRQAGVTPVMSTQQLPKTGLPVLAWTALAFIPAGFKLQKFSQIRKDLEGHPNYIWEEKQFKNIPFH